MHALYLWHISQESEEHVRAHVDFTEAQEDRNPLMTNSIIEVVHTAGGGSNDVRRKRDARINHGELKQVRKNETLTDFRKRYQMSMRTLKSVKCPLGDMDDEEQADDFLHKLDPAYYGEAVRSLDQDRNLGRAGYPRSVQEAYTRMSEWIFVLANDGESMVKAQGALPGDTVFVTETFTEGKNKSYREKV